MGLGVRFGWVKAHAGLHRNEQADKMAKAGCRPSWPNDYIHKRVVIGYVLFFDVFWSQLVQYSRRLEED